MTTINDIITDILLREGWDKFTNHPEDRGGPTKWGITQKAWSDFIERPATIDEVKAITELQARVFYQREYIIAPHFDLIEDEHLRELVIDCAVNHGVYRAARWLQLASDVSADGQVGPKTLFAVNTADPLEIFLWLIAYRIRLYGRLVQKDGSQARFIAGWNNRAAGFLEGVAKRLEAAHREG